MLSGHQFLMQLQLAVVCLCDSFIFLVQSNLTILMVNDATIGNYSAMIDDTRTEPITTPAQLVSPPREYSLCQSEWYHLSPNSTAYLG